MLMVFSSVSCNAEDDGVERSAMTQEKKIVRKAAGSGRWFPGNREQLLKDIRTYMDEADVPQIKGKIVSAIAPHAGYQFSGKVAGYTFKAIEENIKKGNSPETIVILGLSHRAGFAGVALMDGDAIETPLGETELDKEAGKILVDSSKRISFNYTPHAMEHSAENEIPFTQVAAPKAKLVIGLIGDHSRETMDDLLKAIIELSGKKEILVVASTDLLHDPDYELVGKTDKETLEIIGKMDADKLEKKWSPGNQICCGICPVLTAIRFAEGKGCEKGDVLFYRNSGDDDPSGRGVWVVGYGAVVFAVDE